MINAINTFLIFGLGILCIVDTFTTMHLAHGNYPGAEGNSFVAYLLTLGPAPYLIIKLLISLFGLILFWAVKREWWMMLVLLFAGWTYLDAIQYHFEIMSNIP